MLLDFLMGLVALHFDNNLMIGFVLGVFILRMWASLSSIPEIVTEFTYQQYKRIGYIVCLFLCASNMCTELSNFESGMFYGVGLVILTRTLCSMWGYIRHFKKFNQRTLLWNKSIV